MNLQFSETQIAQDFDKVGKQLETLAQTAEAGELDAERGFYGMVQQLPRLRSMVLGAAIRALGATKGIYDMKSRTTNYEPDWNARLKAVVWIASYSDGLPAQTNLNVNIGDRADTSKEQELQLERAVSSSPALKSRLQKLIGPA